MPPVPRVPRPNIPVTPVISSFTLDAPLDRISKASQSNSYDGNPPRTVNPYANPRQNPRRRTQAPNQLAGYESTPNTYRVQDTGLGPSNTNPAQDMSAGDPTNAPNPYEEIGASGLVQYGGFVRDEFLPQLQGQRGLRTYREMWDNDPVVGGMVFMIQMLMRKVEWRVEPPEAPTVAGIVEAREKEHMRLIEQRRQAQQAELMNTPGQGSGASSMAPGASPGASTGGGDPQQGGWGHTADAPGGASPVDPQHEPAFHEPLNAPRPAPAAASPAGLPGDRPRTLPGPQDPGSDTEAGGFRKFPLQKTLVTKAEGSGMNAGDLDTLPVGPFPMDPETQEPMVFPDGTGPFGQPSPQEREAEYLAAFVESCLHDCADSWSDIVSQIVTMIVFGFSFHEIVYKIRRGPNVDSPVQGSKYNDGWVGWAKIAGRAQETVHRWEFDDNGNTVGMWQLAPPKFQLKYIPLAKALLFVTSGYKQNPQGRSVLRSAYRPWYLKKRIEELEAIGIERNLAGLPVAYVPYQWMSISATQEEQQALAEVKKVVRNIRMDEQAGLVFPTILDYDTKHPLFSFELLSAGSGSSSKVIDTDKVISRYDQRIAMVALVDFIMLGMESMGSRSLADTKADLFTTALEAWLSVIADVFNNQAIPRLMMMNGKNPAMSPQLTFGKLSRISLTEIAALLTALAGAGADLFPDPILEDRIREEAGLPPKAATNDL